MQNTYSSTGTAVICKVMAVDSIRQVCKCISSTGTIFADVRWVVPMGGADGAGASFLPVENSQVYVDTSSGFPVIIGALSTDSLRDLNRPNIGVQGVAENDITDYATMDLGEIVRGPGMPVDQRVGDNVFTSDGGGILGLLASGTAVIKSSPLAQMITSRFGDLVRVVSRNFEHFTDVDALYKTSIRGKLYTMRSVFRTPQRSRAEQPSFVRYEGDVAFGETLGSSYASVSAEDFPTEPGVAADVDLVAKEYTYDDANTVTSTVRQNINGAISREIHGDIGAVWSMDSESFNWSANNGDVSITGNNTGFVLNVEGTVNITCGSNGRLSINATDTLNITAGDTTFDLGNVTFNNSGTTTFNSTGNFSVTAPIIELN